MAGRVSIDAVWEATAAVLRERAGRLAPLALLAFALPTFLQSAAALLRPAGPAAASLLVLLLNLGTLLLALWGTLAIIGVASDPPPSRRAAGKAAGRRLPAAIGIAALLLAGLLVVLMLTAGLAVLAGADAAAMAAGRMSAVGGRVAGTVVLAALALWVVVTWMLARLAPTPAVVLHRRRGVRALRDAFAMTRGLGLRLFGAQLLLLLVAVTATVAARAVTGVAFALLLGPDRLAAALLLAAAAAALVAAALNTVVAVFVARLYAALEPAAPAGGPWGSGAAAHA